MGIDAFMDVGYRSGLEFCRNFVGSPEFTKDILVRTVPGASRKQPLLDLYALAARSAETDPRIADALILEYVRRPRVWLSLKLGRNRSAPSFDNPQQLLFSFGNEGWYGPIWDDSPFDAVYYIRVFSVDSAYRDNETKTIKEGRVRWTVVAQLASKYVSFSWRGFSWGTVDEHYQKIMFPFWDAKYVPRAMSELARHTDATWSDPDLMRLVLHDLWSRYIDNDGYTWKHERIRAEAEGVALNAHSAGNRMISEEDRAVQVMQGLEALSSSLADSGLRAAVNSISHPILSGALTDATLRRAVERAMLQTMIQEWGTKSYEFRLTKKPEDASLQYQEGKDPNTKAEKLFRAHCYFGVLPGSRTQDRLQHLKCDTSQFGGNVAALDFLLKHLNIR